MVDDVDVQEVVPYSYSSWVGLELVDLYLVPSGYLT